MALAQPSCIVLTSSLSVRYGFMKSGDFSVIPSSWDIYEEEKRDNDRREEDDTL